ncbi:hypothetical protein T484DRAFT_1895564, partial [Baffinella frigidus]
MMLSIAGEKGGAIQRLTVEDPALLEVKARLQASRVGLKGARKGDIVPNSSTRGWIEPGWLEDEEERRRRANQPPSTSSGRADPKRSDGSKGQSGSKSQNGSNNQNGSKGQNGSNSPREGARGVGSGEGDSESDESEGGGTQRPSDVKRRSKRVLYALRSEEAQGHCPGGAPY